MRIAMIHSHLEVRGGSQRYAIEMTHELRRLGHTVDLFACYYSPRRCFPELVGTENIVSVYPEGDHGERKYQSLARLVRRYLYPTGLDYLGAHVSHLRDAAALARLVGAAQTSNRRAYDVVLAHEGPLCIWAAIKLKKNTGIPVAWLCYDTLDKWYLDWVRPAALFYGLRKSLLNLYWSYDRRIVRRHVDVSVVLDGGMQSRFERFYGIRPLVIRGGINERYLATGRSRFLVEKYGLPPSSTIVGSVTRFQPYRRVQDVCEVGRRLCAGKRNTFIYLNAPVNDAGYYRRTQNEYGDILYPAGNVIVDTAFPANDDELYNIYGSLDVFVFPNEKQTWGNAPVEAMASGCAVVVSDGCGVAEVVKEVTDTVFCVGDVAGLVRIVERLLDDSEWRRKVAATQHAYVRDNLTWKTICRRYETLLDQVVRKAG